MAQQIFNDGSSGDVVIRSGPPASGGGGGSWGGGFGGNRVGASGAFVGVSKKRSRARALARQADRQAKEQQRIQAAAAAAHAQEQARLLTRQQTLAAMQASHVIARAAIDQNYAARAEHLGAVTDQEIRAKRGPGIGVPSSERWQLHSIERQRSLIDELVAQKAAALEANNHVAQAFDGFDPLTRTPDDYLARLGQFGDALAQGHQVWENSYTAAAEARLLAAQISALHDKSSALLKEHATWVERLAAWEKLRQVAEQRDARIRFKQQTDAQARLERVRQANTLSVPIAPSTTALSMLVNPRGLWVAGAADGLAAGMSRAVAALAPLAGALGTLTAGQVAIFAGGMVIPSELGNGELTPEQRQRLYHAVVVPAQALELHDVSELQAIADTGGSVEMEYRAKTLETPEGTAVIVTRTGGEVDTQVPVLNATLDPLTDRYTVDVPGAPARHLEFMPQTTADANATAPSGAALTEPQLLEIPPGVDWRIQDCVVCVPGLEPVYVSFNAAPLGSGVVTGTGQPATADWWKSATQASGAAIPTQIGDVFRGREFTSFAGFDQALWQTLGEDRVLASSFNELNRKRIEQGFAPYAPKSTWVDENREFELRYEERAPFWDDALNLDKISIKTPASAGGWLGIVPAVTPWPIPPASSWKPLQPPGAEQLGSTVSPAAPVDPLVYPGSTAIPVLPQIETFPAVEQGQGAANIPGFPADMELPSSDVLFLDRRDDPGVATGFGKEVSGVWLGEEARVNGAPVPARIAEQLRSQVFRNFHGFRRAFWRAVAADVELSDQFSFIDLNSMRMGKAPLALQVDRRGMRVKFEIHHLDEVAKGGAVYDMDNLLIMTPKLHVSIHSKGKYGNGIQRKI